MADSNDQEPSIEEILASIRQIISDDDEPAAPAPPPPEPEEEDDVLELTEVVEEKEVILPPPPKKVVLDLQDAAPEPETDNSDILTDQAANAALAGFMRLSRDTPLARTHDGITLEDIVRDLMKPMLRDWLDRNLPSLIETGVEKELANLARKAIDE